MKKKKRRRKRAPQSVSDAWLVLAKPVVVGDAREVDVIQPSILQRNEYIVQSQRTTLFHPFQAKLK